MQGELACQTSVFLTPQLFGTPPGVLSQGILLVHVDWPPSMRAHLCASPSTGQEVPTLTCAPDGNCLQVGYTPANTQMY